jgi:hypothetical protein
MSFELRIRKGLSTKTWTSETEAVEKTTHPPIERFQIGDGEGLPTR